ncbi:transposon Tf2-1 polyprotein isoform X1 [Cucumis melo var. makuwa]|uniref:Transposon Tf2-1 polyprotein isoform X1 n=1 Tax=Cucumis melo var. makuwa TaxID=1194695 RepID=A0A5D3E4U3_CUCMM|nr:transposon Tf2-1 polyprotein isoform X1 [Cucumis melo var. makuwa]TYK30952.1 transposon Tf2-1 polyprotein isoform X1 [Cucumis melo var. makuwa]
MRIEERLELMDQEITRVKKEISKMPLIELSLNDIVKNLEVMRLQSEKQQQMLLLLMELMAKDRSAVSDRTTESAARDSAVAKGKESKATSTGRSKFKKVEMSVFIEEDPDSWLFRTGGKFLRIKQETIVEEYRNLFDKLIAPLSDIQESVVEDTFMNGLLPWIRAEVAFCRPNGLAEMMQIAQLVENRELIRNEANLKGFADGKYPSQSTVTGKSLTGNTLAENKGNTTFPIRTITLRSSNANKIRKEVNSRQFTRH